MGTAPAGNAEGYQQQQHSTPHASEAAPQPQLLVDLEMVCCVCAYVMMHIRKEQVCSCAAAVDGADHGTKQQQQQQPASHQLSYGS
jgi:hypothetical protein